MPVFRSVKPSRQGAVAALSVALVFVVAALVWQAADQPENEPTLVESRPVSSEGLALPKELGSLRFAVVGDVGRGDRNQYDTASELTRWRERFDFDFVLMLGDNIYATNGTPEEYAVRFERPYKALLDGGVKFYAANGNHDPNNIWTYPPFNMNGNRYYSFTRDEGPLPIVAERRVQFIALDTVTLDAAQLAWLRRELATSTAQWKICFYHHPLYTSGRYRFVATRTRRLLEPIFVQYGVDVGLSGHEHFYERIIPRFGIQYFTSGAGGALRVGDVRRSSWTAAAFDGDTHFMLMEISGDSLFFQAVSRTGQTIDAGRIAGGEPSKPPPILRK